MANGTPTTPPTGNASADGANGNSKTTFLERFNTSLGPLLLGVLVLIGAGLSALYFPQTMKQKDYATDRWTRVLMPEVSSNLSLSLPGSATTNEQRRFQEQVQHVSNRALHHFDVMQFFYMNHYMQLMLAAIFGGLATIALTLLSKSGWNTANPYLVSFFLTASIATAFFIAFPNMCKMDENVAKNKSLYMKYVALLNDARSYTAVTNFAQGTKITNSMPACDFILYLDGEMKKANDIAVSFDPSKFPVYKIEKTSP
jgi:hypothetical protein